MSDRPLPTRTEIEAAQLDGLRSLLGKIFPANRFYAPRIQRAEVGPDLHNLRDFTRLEFTRKSELVEDQAENPPYGSNLTYPLHCYTRYNQTSGTSGAPLRWLDTTESWNWMVDNWVEVFRTSGVEESDHLFFAFSFGPFLGFWTAFEAGVRLGCLCVPGGGMSSGARLRAILDTGCTALCCTPTYAIHLGSAAAADGIDLRQSSVRRIFAAGEPGASITATRVHIERLWPGARIVDHHGMTEVGPVSVECPARRGVLHIFEHAFLPEVLDPITGDSVRPGAQGELVLTNLGRDGSPLLRYRTGDLVRLDDRSPDEPCACGRYDMALPGGILGRTDDMVVVRGVNVHPSAVEAVVRRFAEVAEFRVRLLSAQEMAEIELEVETDPGCADGWAVASALEAALRDTFNLRMPVRPVEPGTLPRFEMKAKRWVRTTEADRA